MKRILLLPLFVVLSFQNPPVDAAQQDISLAVGDTVLVVASKLAVYTQPDAGGSIVEELIPGMVSYVLKVQVDQTGSVWVYLSKDAYGWVPGSLDGRPALEVFSESGLQNLIRTSSAAIRANPQKAIDAYLARAAAYSHQFKLVEATADYSAAIRLAPTDAWIYDYRGKVKLKARQYANALSDLLQAIALKRELPNTLNRLGIAYENLERYDEALDAYARAISDSPAYGLLYTNRANVYAAQGDAEKAVEEHSEAIRHDPLLAIAYNNRAVVYSDQHRFERAAADYDMAITIDPNCAACYVNRGAFRAEVNHDYPAALVDFDRAIKIDPFDGWAYTNRAATYLALGQPDLAMADLQRAVKLNPDDDYTQFMLGGAYAFQGRYAESLRAYTRAIAIGKRYFEGSFLYRAQVLLALGRYEDAIDDLDTFTALNTEEYFHTVALLIRGAASLYRRDYESALDAYATVWADSAVVAFARAYSSRGGGFRVTIKAEKQIDSLRKQGADALYKAATLCMEFGRWQEAATLYQAYYERTKQPMPDALAAILDLLTS
jgi:tetratricopeptide (TPR) repeat protein